MSLNDLDHYAIRTTKLEETARFFVELLGMTDGERPPFDFPGKWLYVNGKPLVHLIAVDKNKKEGSGLASYLGDVDIRDLQGSGAIDHLAFRCTDSDGFCRRLETFGVAYRERRVPNLDLYQIFVEDPNDITVELNFYGSRT